MEEYENRPIKEGDIYKCIKTVHMDGGNIDYYKDKSYISHFDGCITDEEGCKHHSWSKGLSEHFILVRNEGIKMDNLLETQQFIDENKEKALTHNTLLEKLNYDKNTGIFTWKENGNNQVKKGKIAGTITSKGYISICVNQKRYFAHRLAWFYVYGQFPALQIDHIDRNKTNNAIINLREVTNQENHRNKGLQKNNSTGHVGVGFHKSTNKYRAYIACNGVTKHLGLFNTLQEAVIARNKAESILGFYRQNPEISSYNIGNSDYSQHLLQPWQIWNEYKLNPWDSDIVKRILRTKKGESRIMDYEKIIHNCKERIRQLQLEELYERKDN